MTINVAPVGTAVFSGARNATSSGGTTAATGSTFIIVGYDDGTGRTPTDNKGNSPYVLVGAGFAGFANVNVYAFENGVGGAGHTANLVTTGGSPDCEVSLLEATGQTLAGIVEIIASPQWKDVSGTPGGPFTSNSLTTANANDLLLAIACTFTTSGTESITWGGGYSPVEADGSSAQFSHAVGKLVVSATGTYSASFTSAGGGTSEAVTTLIALKQAGGGGAATQATDQPNRPRPGRGPFSKGRFYVSDTTAYSNSAASITGSGSPTDSADISAGTGSTSIAGSGAATDSADVSAGTGTTKELGSGSPTDSADVSAGTGATSVSGSGAPSDQSDASSGSGLVGGAGSGSPTDSPDISSGTGSTSIAGSGAPTDSPDISAGIGTTKVIGSGVASDSADVAAGIGSVGGGGSGSPTDPGDGSGGTGSTSVAGSGASTDSPDASAGSGSTSVPGFFTPRIIVKPEALRTVKPEANRTIKL